MEQVDPFIKGFLFGAGLLTLAYIPRAILDAWEIYSLKKRAHSAEGKQT